MKIGIVTFYRVANYGAMLQAYSLWKRLEEMGHEVVFVAHPRLVAPRIPLWKVFVSRRIKGMKTKLNSYLRYPITEFAQHFPQTRFCTTTDEVRLATADCDAFIVGSDQMWNPLWCSDSHLPLVMLDFAPEGKPRIAYAASFGTTVWREDQNAALAGQLLGKFSAVSTREESGVEFVRSLSGRSDARCVLDPTLLHEAEFYREIVGGAKASCPPAKPYIFKYLLEWDDGPVMHQALAFVRSMLNIRQVETDQTPAKGWVGMMARPLRATGKLAVAHWLDRIANSDFVFTNSFHGTVFAILFHKPFVSLLLRSPMIGMNERALSLLKKLGLGNRAVFADDQLAIKAAVESKIDWQQVDETLVLQRVMAIDFIRRALSNE